MTSKAKDFWGPALWRTIHSFAASYDPKQYPKQKNQVRAFFQSLEWLMPCDKCQEHFRQLAKEISVEDYLTDNHSLFLWTYIIHDAVNKSVGKTSPPYEDVKVEYFNALGERCSSCENN